MRHAAQVLKGMVLLVCLGNSALLRAEERLIEVAPGERVLWSERQMRDFALERRKSGFCGGFFDVTDFQADVLPAVRASEIFDGRTPAQSDKVHALSKELSAGQWFQTVERLSTFHNRFYKSDTGVAAMHWVRDRFAEIGASRRDFSVELVSHAGFPQPSVIARLQGRGPYAAQRIVLGAHGDSINWSGFVSQARAPGADDDASGVASLLEIFRVMVVSGYQPDRTIEFMVYAAEERGLLGSQAIAREYNLAAAPVTAVLQLDMTGYPGQKRTIHLISDYVSRGLTQFLAMLIDTYIQLPWAEESCGYACSDHASWNKVGFPSAFPFEASNDEYNRHIHTESDTADRLDAAFSMAMVKLGLAFALELATENSGLN